LPLSPPDAHEYVALNTVKIYLTPTFLCPKTGVTDFKYTFLYYDGYLKHICSGYCCQCQHFLKRMTILQFKKNILQENCFECKNQGKELLRQFMVNHVMYSNKNIETVLQCSFSVTVEICLHYNQIYNFYRNFYCVLTNSFEYLGFVYLIV
jgi:hypothetical protein